MLVMYSTVLRKRDFLKRFSEDATKTASLANDLTCSLKTLAVISGEERLDSSLDEIKELEISLNHLNAMVNNLKENLQGYVNSLATNSSNKEEQKTETSVALPAEDPKQITDVLAAIKSLKELKDSLPNENKKV